jgi:lysophospholipase L1-like esterase
MEDKKKSWIYGNLLLSILAPIVFLGTLEIITRLIWHKEIRDHHVGIVFKVANSEIVIDGINYRTNSQAIRYREIEDKRSTNQIILALGDSFIWGDGLPEEALVTTKIERMLQTKFPGIMVINAGIPEYNTSDEYEQLVRLASIYQPDHVLLFFFTNDVLARKDGEKGDRAALSWRQNIKEYLRSRSKFLAFLYYQYKTKYVARIGVPKYLLPPDYFSIDESKPGWKSFQRALLQIRNYCREHNITLQFVIIPTLTCLNDNYPYLELHNKVKEFVTKYEVPLIDLFGVLAPYPPADLWVNLENTHWNDKATSLAAEEIVKNFNKMNILQ